MQHVRECRYKERRSLVLLLYAILACPGGGLEVIESVSLFNLPTKGGHTVQLTFLLHSR
jgi:hypothetical protein